jgi:hypothetical protein
LQQDSREQRSVGIGNVTNSHSPSDAAPLEPTIKVGFPSARPLTRDDCRTLALSASGGALEYYDFVIFVFFAQVLGQLFFPTEIPDRLRQFQTVGIFAVGYFVRPLGGIFIAHLGDMLGRKRMVTFSILMLGACAIGCAVGIRLSPLVTLTHIWRSCST